MLLRFYHTLLFVILITPLNFSAQIIREASIQGKPRFVLEESFEGKVENGNYIKTGKDRQISWMNDSKMEFDRNGNLVKRSYYDDMRRFMHAEQYEFNNLQLNRKKFLSFIYSYEYDSNGNVSEEWVAPITDSTSKKIKHRFAYDINNRLSDIWELDFRGGSVCHQMNTYNAKGLITKETYVYSDGEEYKNFTYDLQDNLIKMEWLDNSIGILERTTYTYSNGILVSEFWEGIEKNKVETSTKFDFDKYGNPLSILDVNPKRQIHDHEVNQYEMDEFGNWITKKTMVNQVRCYIVERKIAYY